MVKTFTLTLGVILLGIGLWGAISGGHYHELVIFGVNANHNWVHILSGALAIGAGLRSTTTAKNYCLIFGAVYGLVTVLGFLNVPQVVALLNLNTADNFLHLGIAASCLYFGLKTPTLAGVSFSARRTYR